MNKKSIPAVLGTVIAILYIGYLYYQYSKCNGVLVRGLFGMECIHG